jgi:hypothetical protein
MSINTYASLKTSIVSWLDINTSDVTSVIDDLITVAETRINREAQSKDTEEPLSATVASGVAAVPADYQMLKFAYLNTNPVTILERRTPAWIYQQYPNRSGASIPSGGTVFVGREGTNFIFGPCVPDGYIVKGVYFRNNPAISVSAHDFFVNNPELYLMAALAESEILIGRDNRIVLWEAKYQNLLKAVNNLDDSEAISGSHLEMRSV